MVVFRRFVDIDAWQRARERSQDVYSIASNGPFGKDRSLENHIRRAAKFISLNVAGGFGRSTHSDFANYLDYALGSDAGVKAALYIAKDRYDMTETKFDRRRILAGILAVFSPV